MARTKTAPKPRKASAKRGSIPGKAGAAQEVARLRPGLAFPVAAIGASAGGLAAFTELLKALPARSGMAFVLIQHLEPKHESALTTLLSKATSMPVAEVSDGMAVEPNCVYVIPPNRDMTIRQGTLRLAPRSAVSGIQRPIDDFAIALAEEQGDAAIGVVLSGTGSDGTYGLKAIKAAGGVTFAQDPKSAQWPAMPMSAITAGSVDFVLSPKRIAAELARIGRHPYLADAHEVPEGSDLDKVCMILRASVGVDFRLYKQATVRRRIARRMALQKIASLSRYAQVLKQNPEEAQALADDVFIHVTRFFRDPECFQALRKQVLEKLSRKRATDDPIRIWVAGCSTGEEVYSIAILLLEELGERAGRIRIQIFGTDIQERAVEHARAGLYTAAAVAGVSPARLKRFFAESDFGYQIRKSIRDLCVFARHDLARDPPFSRLDLISCRNVLIYMGPALQKRLLSVFQYALKPGGSLFLGNSESVGDYSDAFTAEDQKHRIYSRKLTAPAFREFRSAIDLPREPNAVHARTAASGLAVDFRKEAESVLLEQYAPPAIVVDPDLHIVHFQGDVSPYLAPSTGQPSFHLLKMVRPELVVDLRTAIYKARKEHTAVRKEAVQFSDAGRPAAVRLEVQPLQTQNGPGRGGRGRNGSKPDLLVVFRRAEPASPTAEEGRRPGRTAGSKQAIEKGVRLERELASTREHLRVLIADHETTQEEMKAANEEILSSNEELQSTNEELETAKEELQSANEELVTLNDELQHRNDELTVLTSDLSNLLTGVDIPVLVLDNNLHVRRFTPVAGSLLNLIPGDVGRPFSDIASTLDVTGWDRLFAEVTGQGRLIEREVTDRKGHRYSLRVRPYKTSEGRIDGVLVVMLDNDLIYRALDEAQTAGDQFRAVFETTHEALVVMNSGFRVLTVNRSFCELFHSSPAVVAGQPFFDLSGGQWNIPELRKLFGDILPKSTQIKDFEIDREFPGIGRRVFALNAGRIEESGTILLAIDDITARKQAQEQELRVLRSFVERAPNAILMLDRRMRGIQVSQRWLDDVGLTRDRVIGRSHYDNFPNLPPPWPELHRRGLAGESLSGREETYIAADGSEHYINWEIVPWGDAGEATGGILISMDDITAKKRAETEARQSAATIRALIESAPQSVIVVNTREEILLANGNVEKMFGYPPAELTGQKLNVLVPEDLRARHSENHKTYFADMQTRPMGIGLDLTARRRDGTTFPVEIGLSVIETTTGKQCVAFVSDITQRKEFENAALRHAGEVQALAASLLTAQEEERRRVSRELHDQICQQMAALAIDIGSFAAAPPPDRELRLKELQARAVEVSEQTRHIAYELHPSIIDDLGLAASLRDLCRQFSEGNRNTALEFIADTLPAAVPREVASGLYRVTQECLQNISKHANAGHVRVELTWRRGTLGLTVSDDGAGFDMNAIKGRGGLGLIGMEERVRLIKGKLAIKTQPRKGTRISVEIPLP